MVHRPRSPGDAMSGLDCETQLACIGLPAQCIRFQEPGHDPGTLLYR